MNRKKSTSSVGYIYQLTFADNHHLRYIGQTIDIEGRMHLHRRDAAGLIGGGNQRLVSMAWLAYGEPEVLILATVQRHMMDFFEKKLIGELRTLHPHGLNARKGGGGRSSK